MDYLYKWLGFAVFWTGSGFLCWFLGELIWYRLLQDIWEKNWFGFYICRRRYSNDMCLQYYRWHGKNKGRYAAKFRLRNLKDYMETRRSELNPKRMKYAVEQISALGYEVQIVSEVKLSFFHDGEVVTFFPYTGWASGKSIQDGRGIKNLLKQLKP